MRYWFDTEFIEDGKTIDLLSIGIVSEDGRTLYLQNAEAQFQKAGDWVWRNVFPHLVHFDMPGKRACSEVVQTYDSGLGHRHITPCGTDCPWNKKDEIRDAVLKFCSVEKYGKPELWGYYADYDWVAFCQLFGTMVQLPKGFPMYCRDLKQWCDTLGNPKLPEHTNGEHNALVDAYWTKGAFEFLRDYKPA